MTLSRRFGGIFPATFLKHVDQQIAHAGYPQDAAVWVGSRFILLLMYSILGGIGYYVASNFNEPWLALAVAASIGIVIVVLFYLGLYYRILARTRKLERLLPDFLMLIAANLRAGMTPFGAFVKALRPEFGDLYEEGKRAAAGVGGRRSLEDALNYLGGRFDSPIFRRSLGLFLKGVRSGSQLARLLTTTAEEIRKIQDLREELVSTTRTYMIFIGFVVVIVMPFLLSISAFFLEVFVQVQEQIGFEDATTAGIPLLICELGVTSEDVTQVSLVALVVTSMLASALIGIIRTGRWIYGIKYFPFMATAAVIFFFLADKGLGQIIQ